MKDVDMCKYLAEKLIEEGHFTEEEVIQKALEVEWATFIERVGKAFILENYNESILPAFMAKIDHVYNSVKEKTGFDVSEKIREDYETAFLPSCFSKELKITDDSKLH